MRMPRRRFRRIATALVVGALAAGMSAAPAGALTGSEPVVISSPYGHDAFLIEDAMVGPELARLLEA